MTDSFDLPGTIGIPELIEFLHQQLHDLPDTRKPGNNTKYKVEDAVISAFSVFFTQSPSFLEHQRLMKNIKGKDNASSLFNIKEIPCDNQIRNLLDPIPASTIFGAFKEVYQWLKKQGTTVNINCQPFLVSSFVVKWYTILY